MFSVPVRELIEFVLRRGNLGGERDFVGADRALAGIRGHQRIQRTRPAGYQKEISVSHEVVTEESIMDNGADWPKVVIPMIAPAVPA